MHCPPLTADRRPFDTSRDQVENTGHEDAPSIVLSMERLHAAALPRPSMSPNKKSMTEIDPAP
jgi:hypothetical protein